MSVSVMRGSFANGALSLGVLTGVSYTVGLRLERRLQPSLGSVTNSTVRDSDPLSMTRPSWAGHGECSWG